MTEIKQPEEQGWEKVLKEFHTRAKQERDSGYCGGCYYYETVLKSFVATQREQAAQEEREKVLREFQSKPISITEHEKHLMETAEEKGRQEKLKEVRKIEEDNRGDETTHWNDSGNGRWNKTNDSNKSK